MKPISILLGLSLITNINQPILNNQKLTLNLSIKSVELVEKSSFDTLAAKNFSELSIQEAENLGKPTTISPNSCEEMYTAAMSACSSLFWNPPAFAVCAAAASAAYAACLAAR